MPTRIAHSLRFMWLDAKETQAYPTGYAKAVFNAYVSEPKVGKDLLGWDTDSDDDDDYVPIDAPLAQLEQVACFAGVSTTLLQADFRP